MDVIQSSLSGVFAGRYSLEGVQGTGATSTVYRARDTRTDRPVAIKLLRRELVEAIGPDRFLREIRLTEKLHHPRILPILDSGEYNNQLFFVAPFMDGGTLRQRLERERQLAFADAIRITCTVADALAYAHSQGFIHRDVKPDNLLFAGDEVCLADFGIARAIERSIDDVSTSTGIARGTPAYMSPEQASGARDYDGRSDVYSLGCVLYEMVTGMRPFLGPTAQAVISQRFLHAPRPLAVYRPTAPASLQAVINCALEISPADRYRTAAEFAAALRAIPETDLVNAEKRSPRFRALLSSRRGRVGLVAGVVVLAAGLGFTTKWSFNSGRTGFAIDTTRIVVLPLEGAATRASLWHDDDLMHQGLSRWRGLHVVDEFQVADAMRRAGPLESTNSAEELARSLGAGRYVRGRLIGNGNNWRASVSLYEIGKERALYSSAQQLPADLPDVTAAYERLVDSLLLRGSSVDANAPESRRSKSLPAVQAFGRAQDALDQWDLASADSAFQAATAFDPDYAQASLWLAQIRAWRGQSPQNWTILAERALALSDQLSERERQLAAALVFLSRSQYAQSCDVYTRLTTRNDHDFAAWFGLGQCRMMDHVVVADKASPSGWRFRSSVARGMDAYAKAFEILPSVHRGYERGAFERLRSLLLVSRDITPGFRLGDSAAFWGRLGMVHDSVVMVAFPWQVMFSGDSTSIPPGFEKALARRRADFLRIAAGWSAAFPENAGAKHAVGVALELRGDEAAIDTLRLARSLEKDSTRKIVLGTEEVLLLAKFGLPDDLIRLKRSRALADSLLIAKRDRNPAEAAALAPIAALSGRCEEIDALVRAATPTAAYPGVAVQIAANAGILATRLAMGCAINARSLRMTSKEIEQAIGNAPRERHQMLDQQLLYRAVILNPGMERPVTDHLSSSTNDDLLLAARAIAHGDTAAARAHLIAVDKRAGAALPTPDITLARAQLWNNLGDPLHAETILDTSLQSVVSYDPETLKDPVNAGALASMVALRGQLAQLLNHASAKRWTSAATILWASADGEVKSSLAKLAK